MRIGFIGLGKLGLPCATCIDLYAHDVMGFDLDPSRMSKEPQPYQERGPEGKGDFNDYLSMSHLRFGSFKEVVEHGEIIFVAVQTPHEPKYEGISPLPDERKDFNYSYLTVAIKRIAQYAKEDKIISIISTCLPGTTEREILSSLNSHMKLVYNPFFIAMGTTMRDFRDPEFVLLGTDDYVARNKMCGFYGSIHSKPIQCMSIASAECVKVFYNTFVTSKICFANVVGRICHETPGANTDDVMGALKIATDRIISPRYMDTGMGDGGGCHPRDNIALSFIARQHGWKYDPWNDLMMWREGYARWLAKLLNDKSRKLDLPIVILGYAFKPETNLVVGSPALLAANLLKKDWGRNCQMIDSHIDDKAESDKPSVILIGCKHPEYAEYTFPKGSVVIDPHRYILDQEGVEVIRIGE